MSVAVLFPGQGRPLGLVGRALLRYERAERLIEVASHETGVDLRRMLDRGHRDLQRTELYQPALTALCLGAFESLRERAIPVAFVAGHSLGELIAWGALGVAPPEQVVAIAAARGRAMARAAAATPGGMLALLGADADVAQDLLEEGRLEGELHLGAHNAPDEWVLTGAPAALARVRESASEGVDARELDVAGSWHSRAMAGAAEELLAAFAEHVGDPPSTSAGPTRAPILIGCAARAIDPSKAPAELARTLVSPVRWVEVLRTLQELGATHFVCVSPDGIMRSLLRRNLGGDVPVSEMDDLDRPERLAALLELAPASRAPASRTNDEGANHEGANDEDAPIEALR